MSTVDCTDTTPAGVILKARLLHDGEGCRNRMIFFGKLLSRACRERIIRCGCRGFKIGPEGVVVQHTVVCLRRVGTGRNVCEPQSGRRDVKRPRLSPGVSRCCKAVCALAAFARDEVLS